MGRNRKDKYETYPSLSKEKTVTILYSQKYPDVERTDQMPSHTV